MIKVLLNKQTEKNIYINEYNAFESYVYFSIEITGMTRNQFFLLLFVIFVGPFFANKLLWLATSTQTTGTMRFTGHDNLGSVLGMSSYPVIRFKAGRDTIYFNGNINLDLRRDELVSIRYQKNNPSDAKINTFVCVWGDTMAYSLLPFLILLVVYLHPDIIPKKSKIFINKKSMIKIIPPGT